MYDLLISLFLLLPLLYAVALSFMDSNNLNSVRKTAAILASFTLILTLTLQFSIDFNINFFSYYKTFCISEHLNIYFTIALDGLSYYLILLTSLLTVVCIGTIWEIKYKLKEFLIILFIIEFLLVNAFSTIDIFFFYMLFEATLIPMFLMIGLWGGRNRRIDAAYQFFLYTFVGSIFMLVAILYIYFTSGTTNVFHLASFNYLREVQLVLWLAFFLAFAVKVPMMPIHLWLPEAHTEAPTAGSVLLAGILLKLGTYGMIRFLIPLFPHASGYYTPMVFTMSVVAVIYTSLTALRQGDLKKAIAYSSVAHMSLVTIGLFTDTVTGIKGATFLMISHGVVSSALFIIIGVIYDRYKTRNLRYYGGLTLVMPLFACLFLVQILSNMGFPGTSGFIGEFLILLMSYNNNTLVSILTTTGVVLSAAYSIWLYNRVSFGNIKHMYIKYFSDANEREFSTLIMLSLFTVILGVYPNTILNTIDHAIIRIVG